MEYIYGVCLPLIWACRHLSGAARVYIPQSIFRLPYSSHLSYIVVFYHCGRNKTRGLDPFIFSIKDSLHVHRWYGTFYYRDTTAYIMTIPSSPCSNVVRIILFYKKMRMMMRIRCFSLIRRVNNSLLCKVVHSSYPWYIEAATPRIIDTENRPFSAKVRK